MGKTYYAYVAERGWWTNASGYSSEIKDAKSFTHEEAIEFCRRRYSKVSGQLAAFPISEDDVLAVSK